jgi:hypothetical protein
VKPQQQQAAATAIATLAVQLSASLVQVVLMKITRDEYRRGLKKLNTNSFKSSDEQKEWETFRDSLSPTTLAIASAEKWE